MTKTERARVESFLRDLARVCVEHGANPSAELEHTIECTECGAENSAYTNSGILLNIDAGRGALIIDEVFIYEGGASCTVLRMGVHPNEWQEYLEVDVDTTPTPF